MPEVAFHFLRPWWLLALVPTLVMLMLILRRERAEAQWGSVIAPHLLRHLLVEPQARWRLRPIWTVTAALTIGIAAMAGPAWRRERPPFVEDKAPLMIALDVSASMGQADVPPSRLERARQKIRDLLATRGGARTGLVAYAGTAHLVMPLTDDRVVIEPFLAALSPGLMPVEGKNLPAALATAADALARETIAGTILVVADAVTGIDDNGLRQAAGRHEVLILRVGPPGDAPAITAMRDTAVIRATVDDSDIRALERRIESDFEAAQADETGARWRDEGYWLMLPVAMLALLWFRRGSTVQWVALLVLLDAAPSRAQDAMRLMDAWLTPDQQGRLAFERGGYAEAARLFADPMWRGIAAYRAYDYLAASAAFQHIDTAAGRFALGNAQAHNHAWERAIKAYEDVLAMQPDNAAARTNLAIVHAAMAAADAKRQQQEKGQSSGDLRPDEVKVEPGKTGGKRTLVQPGDVTTPGAAEAWMRQIQTTPADFLKLKFASQAARAK